MTSGKKPLRDGLSLKVTNCFAIILLMDKGNPTRRLTETLPGRLAALLLAAIWIVSMAAVDSNAYSVWPFLVAIALVALLYISGMLCGGKTIRLPWLGWVSLLSGGYFLGRSLCSYAVVESWLESSIIVSCCVFYIAGIYGAQSKSGKFVLTVLVLALVLNLLYLCWRPGEIEMLWTGRPEYGLSGRNTSPVTLFVYKNFAGAFLMLGGGVLLGVSAWMPLKQKWRFLCIVIGLVAVGGSFFCQTRVVFLLGPFLLCVCWLLQFIVELFTRDKVRRVTTLCGIIVTVLLCAELGNFFVGSGLYQISDINSHGRFELWKSVLRMASDAPWWGEGTAASHWEIITAIKWSRTPNMAHNEYLQAWGDYGVMGLVLQLTLIILHALMGFRALSKESLAPVGRGMVAGALTVLIGFSVISFCDFYWHSYALATMTAFCCGVLGAPPAVSAVAVVDIGEKRRVLRHDGAVRVQGIGGRGMMGILGMGVIGFTCWQYGNLSEAWASQWQFNRLNAPGMDEHYEKRLSMLENIMKTYPASEVVDCYFMLPHYGGVRPGAEEVLRMALAANPRQGYTLTMLVTILGLQERYAEAEILMRRYYPQKGLPPMATCNWPFFYYYNLLNWSVANIKQGKQEVGMSMADYAINMHTPLFQYMSFGKRSADEPWKKSKGPYSYREVGALTNEVKRKLRLLRRLGVQKDDSWMQPMEPGGKTALYPQLGIKPEKREGAQQKR